MSSPTNSTETDRVLPSAAIDRLFARLVAIFGAQRMAAAWGNVDVAERNAVWSRAIGRAVWSSARDGFDLESIGAALDELAAEPTTWPPSCGEFADACARFAQRPGRNLKALPVPRRTAEELARGAEHMDAIKALLGRRRAAAPGRAGRVPGEDDVPPAPPPACTCWVGLTRSEVLCESCASFRRNRAAMDAMRDGTADEMARAAA